MKLQIKLGVNIMDKKVSNELKILALEMINNAGSGHSGSVLSCADAIFTLYTKHLLTNGKKDMSRDRFVFSNGHVCACLYAVLAGMGYIDYDEIKSFRKFGSHLAGHPEIELDPIDCNTGPLGQGIANAVGFAIAETIMNKQFGLSNYTYCMTGDGCLQEGVGLEALSVAGLHKLNKLILFYDNNKVTLDGKVTNSSTDDMIKKFKSMNFNVIKCNGYNINEIDKAIIKAKSSKEKPSVIVLNTLIAKDTSLEGNNLSHGAVFSVEEINKLKKLFNNNNEYLKLSNYALNYLKNKKEEINLKINKKINNFNEKLAKNNKLLKKYNNFINNDNKYKIKLIQERIATREANNLALADIARTIDNVVVLSADLSSSTKVKINNGGNYSAENRLGKNIPVGIREHAMGAIANGIALYGGLVPVCSTFLTFSNYMLPPIRMAGIMNLPVIFTFSHSTAYDVSDGITHVPVEQIDQLRLIPNITTFRPSDIVEIKSAYDWFYKNKKPICLCVSKSSSKFIGVENNNGAVFVTHDEADINIWASGTEVELALQVKEELNKSNIKANVVSVASLEVFDQLPSKNKKQFLNKPIFVIEASSCIKYLKYTSEDHIFNMKDFGMSGDGESIRNHFGYVADVIAKKINKLQK